ncbi:MAG: SHOCT domain-containing protein [Bacteroidetes bacterium]|nr:SHOCT domain-containing protein [Bacteroidota bacterium]
MLHEGGYWGMHMIWWVVWGLMLFWVFAIPYDIPGQRSRKNSPLELLQRRFASGQITNVQYEEDKKLLQNDGAK